MAEALNLVFVPREFQPAGDSFDERFHFLGPLLGNREQAQPWSPPDPETRVLFISLGTIFTHHPEFYRTCIEVQELGLGERLTADTVTAEALRATVTRITSHPGVHANLDRMRKAIRDSGGATRGADVIEEYLR
ncbi:MAG: hypothetical protein ACRDTA_17210 [Pseudonocardiaceae bacterium]